jgi:hypothetical protein
MRKEIIIKGENGTVLSVSLIDVLKQINKPEEITWKILWLEAVGKLREGVITDFEEAVNSSETGYMITFSELLYFAESIDQIYEILLIGSFDNAQLKRYESDREMKNACDYCIELIDSSFWEISSVDEKFIENLVMLQTSNTW